MISNYKAVIVGGGASGLMCAVDLLRCQNHLQGKDLLIIEKNDRVGKKLISTGNGQGNLCNANFSLDFYHGNDAFIREFFDGVKDVSIQEYLMQIGIPLTEGKDGKQYPISKQASAVLDILRAFLSSKGCNMVTGETVKAIKKSQQDFNVITDKNSYNAKNVVLAVGGKAGKQFGTDGTSYSLAQSFGHKTTQLYPSLVQLKTDLSLIRGLKGLKETAKVIAFDGEKQLASATGDLLFTEYGISGNAVFQVSGYLTCAKSPKVIIEFLPEYTYNQVVEMLTQRQELNFLQREEILVGIINKRIGQAVLKSAKDTSINMIAKALKNFSLNVTGNLGFNYAQVTKGGIDTRNVNALTMESKLQKGLYLTGEMLDVDGDCGGYNLTFAFLSGIVCAKNIKSQLSQEN